ncbi:unnamed protein product [Spirodela intermedia]|uniref:Uncharacterized protein n=1 Tax=Spirodela intermedia TaxID=51605 RepID=A0A7I8LAS4_SPIIN|nr:unnamed protein product [Spirodela intermedia]
MMKNIKLKNPKIEPPKLRDLIELQLADGSTKKPYGRVNDISVKVEGLEFLVDFIITDMKVIENLNHAPIILGRPFLTTASVATNFKKETISLSVGQKKVEIDMNKVMKCPEVLVRMST